MSESEYDLQQLPQSEPVAANPEYRERRRLAAALRRIIDRLVRVEAPQQKLTQWADQAEQWADDVASHPRRQQQPLLMRLWTGKGSQQDALDMGDHDIMTGLSAAMAPPLELWLDGDVVRGRATLGPAWQGPPGRVHGGVVALMLDILMAKCQDLVHGLGMTGTLNIRYQAGTPLRKEVLMEARIQRIEGRKMFVEGRFFVDGEQTVLAEGIWISMQEPYRWRDGHGPQ
ncbi:PaaI family thioesterase [Isoalcanivorax beigongshangi]|uniref:Acyl-coenzyme A thioesterase THEM4 n=1 Tax=Isoalcanivorax beigongshangi TaxID=3238810 RepID=A0ABV4ALS7_9GAMM